jgi:enoyl ACP reductase
VSRPTTSHPEARWSPSSLDGHRLLVTGIATTDSIAFATASAAQRSGARVVVSAFPRDGDLARQAVDALPEPVPVVECDATSPADLDRLARSVVAELGGLDGAVHAIAYAPSELLAGNLVDAPTDRIGVAFATSVTSYVALGRLLAGLAPPTGGALVGLDFDASGAWPVYNWMGVCKAALESANRYLARDLGPRRIRANLVAAGPLHTRAADAIPGFSHLLSAWDATAPLGWDPTDASAAADAACFLLSRAATAITGEILHVDGGYHAMAAPMAPDDERPHPAPEASSPSRRPPSSSRATGART